MTFFLVNLLLAVLWAALNLFRTIDLISGFLLGYFLLVITRDWLGDGARNYARKVPVFVGLLAFYCRELLISTWEVTVLLFRDQSTIRPGIIAVPLDAKTDLELVLFNNLLFFTPGTLGVHLSDDLKTLYVHVVDVPDPQAACNRIKTGLEQRLLEVLR